MAQFIHLSLLLAAAVQLPLVSVTWIRFPTGSTVTFKLPPHWSPKYCCNAPWYACADSSMASSLHRDTVNSGSLTFNNLISLNATVLYCYGASVLSSGLSLYLTVTTVCSLDYCDVNVSESQPNHLSLCIENHSSQYCTPYPSSVHCIPILSRDKVVIHLTHSVSGCPPGHKCSEINGLHFYHEAKSWIDALEHCHNQNSSLVQITKQTVQSAVNCLLQDKINGMQDGVWIGLERSIFGNSVPWMWTSGLEVKDPQQWDSSFPVDRFNNHCGKIIWVKESQAFKWLDASCHEELPFMCQDSAKL